MTSPTETRPRHPVPDFAQQDTRFSRAFDILRQGIARRAFPGASVAVTYQGRLVALKGLGRFTYEPDSPAVQADTIYDLASVTKVVATTTMAMILYERGLLDLDISIERWLPEMNVHGEHTRWKQITPRMLLAHSSGLPAYEKLFEIEGGPRNVWYNTAALAAVGLEHDPGTHAQYSDIGFILLGVLLERATGKIKQLSVAGLLSSWDCTEAMRLAEFCRRDIFQPLGMNETRFLPPTEWRPRIPPTEEDRTFRKRTIQGEVHDENAFALGGMEGHAGLFAPAADVARFAECLLGGGHPILRPETVALFTRRQDSPPGTSRALGWDTPSPPSQSGKYLSPRSFGHLGYTGTSLWIDPERRLSVTLLTNRTWPDRSSQLIKEIRPRFHDAVVESLEGGS